MKSVAIVGFASATREEVRRSEVDEVWSLNMLHSSPAMRRIFPLNITRLFELHPKWMLQKDWYSINGDHWGWLTRIKHHYPVYLIDNYPEVYNGICYPLETITEKYLSRIYRGDENPVKYFTSSFCYMLALAIYEGFDHIECFGFEMGSETEYVYQKSGAEFWLGIASQYADIYLSPKSLLLKSKLYGFEGGQLIMPELIDEYRQWYLSAYDVITQEQTPDNWIQAQLLNGAITLCDEIKSKGDTISRQVLESYKEKFISSARKLEAEVNMLNAQAIENRKNNGDGEEQFRNAFDRIKFLYRYDGAFQLAHKLIQECDLQSPEKLLDNRYRWHKFSEVKNAN